jgi:hypothetical protein
VALPQFAAAAISVVPRSASVAFWDGNRFHAANRIQTSETDFVAARLTIRSYGQRLPISELILNTRGVAFHTWSAPPVGCPLAACTADVSEGLDFQYKLSRGSSPQPLKLSRDGSGHAGLSAGLYILTEKPLNRAAYSYNPGQNDGPLIDVLSGAEAPFGYVVLRLERS